MLLLPMKTKKTIEELKQEYIKYYEDVPVQKYACMFIGRDEDTIIRWRKEDTDFADAIQRAKADWIRKKLVATKAEFALERLEKAVFSEKATIELEVDTYAKFVKENTINPNAPDARRLADETLQFLMARTKRNTTNQPISTAVD